MSDERLLYTVLGHCSGCGKPAVFERYTREIVTKIDDAEHDSEACKASRDEAMKRARKATEAKA